MKPFFKLQMPNDEQFCKHPFKSPFWSDNMDKICVKFKLVEFDSNKLNEKIEIFSGVIVLKGVISEVVEVLLIKVLLVVLEEALVVVVVSLVTRAEPEVVLEVDLVSVVSAGMLCEISVVGETTVVARVELAHLSSVIRFVWFAIDK
jgi:hypothetical protein